MHPCAGTINWKENVFLQFYTSNNLDEKLCVWKADDFAVRFSNWESYDIMLLCSCKCQSPHGSLLDSNMKHFLLSINIRPLYSPFTTRPPWNIGHCRVCIRKEWSAVIFTLWLRVWSIIVFSSMLHLSSVQTITARLFSKSHRWKNDAINNIYCLKHSFFCNQVSASYMSVYI